jgi:hypothetical protein
MIETLTRLWRRALVLETEDVEMKSIAVLGIVLAACVSVPAIAFAQEPAPEAPSGYHHTVHHHYHNGQHYQVHRFEAHNPAHAATPVVAAPPPPAQAAPFGLSWPHIAPYPNNKGDEDGMSEDEDDCNKGCIDGNTPD